VSKGGGNNLNYQSKTLPDKVFFYIDDFEKMWLKEFLR